MFHGTPGSRVFARILHAAAASLGVRLIGTDRPGYGRSSAWTGCLADYPEDIVQLADALGFQQFGVLGVSGGGPYSLACAQRIPHRLASAALVSAIGPLYLRDATREMVSANRWILSMGKYSPRLTGTLLLLMTRLTLFSMRKHLQSGTSPTPDMSPELFALVMADQRTAFQSGGHGVAFDMRSLWHPWDFQLEEIEFPIHLWHGETDSLAPVSLAHFMAELLPHCHATFYPGEDHIQPLLRRAEEIIALM